MYFYRDVNGLFHMDDKIIPVKTVIMNVYNNDTIINFMTVNKIIITPSVNVTDIQRENGTTYSSLQELLNETLEFFSANIIYLVDVLEGELEYEL